MADAALATEGQGGQIAAEHVSLELEMALPQAKVSRSAIDRVVNNADREIPMNFCPPCLALAIFLLIAQTVGFGIWARACTAALDIPSQIRHNTQIVNNSGYSHASMRDCGLFLARSGAC